MKDFNITALKNTTAEEVAKILEPLHHRAHGTYNKWTVQRDKKSTYSYPEALDAIKRISNTPIEEPQSTHTNNVEASMVGVSIVKRSIWSCIKEWLLGRVSWFTKLH